MKSKRFVLASLLIVAAIILGACSNNAATATEAPTAMQEQPTAAATMADTMAPSEAPTATVEEPTTASTGCPLPVEDGATITFSGWGDATEQQIYKDSITRFNAVCPGVTVNYVPVPDQFQDKMKAQMAAGTAPDVMYIDDQLMTAFASSGQLLDLTPYMQQAGVSTDQFVPALFTLFSQNGKIYALPKDWGTLGLVYLPEAFTAAGIDRTYQRLDLGRYAHGR